MSNSEKTKGFKSIGELRAALLDRMKERSKGEGKEAMEAQAMLNYFAFQYGMV